MKAILVIDIEDKAFEYYSKQNPKALTVDLMDHVGESRGFYRPKFLSLKPMPQKKQHEEEIDYDYGYIDGWNDCIDEILGGNE